MTRPLRLGVLAVLLILVAGITWRQLSPPQVAPYAPDAKADPLGYENYIGPKVPGNPTYAVVSLKRIYEWLKLYEVRHPDTPFPPEKAKLIEDMMGSPQAYGIAEGAAGFAEIRDIMTNPDGKYADSPTLRNSPGNSFLYLFVRLRPDGTAISGPKQNGTRDVLVWTDLYYHMNLKHLPHGQAEASPIGFYLVLWEDGEVERVPYDRILYVRQNPKLFTYAFPGQAGIPSGTLTYWEFQKRHAVKFISIDAGHKKYRQ